MATHRTPIDRSKLTGDQIKKLDQWEHFFAGPLWRDIIERYQPEIEALQNSYHSVQGEQMLGRTQGALSIFYRILVHLPDLIHTEFLIQAEQTEDEGSSADEPVFPEDWRR